MDITRRGLLKAGSLAGLGIAMPVRFSSTAWGAATSGLTKFTEPLPTLTELGVIDLRNAATSSATITMVNASHRFHDGLGLTDTLAYRQAGGAQTYLGPVIVAKQGQTATVTMQNSLSAHPLDFAIDPGLVPAGSSDAAGPRTAIHLHGGNTDAESDGAPTDTFLPTESRTYTYGNTQEAAGLWYHDHALGITRLNVYAGLASGYLIRNDDDLGDGTRLPGAPYEVPLIIQDRMFDLDGGFAYPPSPFPSTVREWAPEFFGDVATVNGKAWPNLMVDRGKYRFRVYNGSNARFYDLKLWGSGCGTMTFLQIGTDGGLLDAPVPLRRLVLAPGERADLVVDFAGLAPGTTVQMRNTAPTPYPNGPQGEALLPDIMRFRVTSRRGWTRPMPRRLRAQPITRLSRLKPNNVRTMTLVEIVDESDSPVMALLNNRTFMGSTDWQTPPALIRSDDLERWDIVNLTEDAHPIHLHFPQYQVLNRQKVDAAGYQTAVYGDGPVVPDSGPYPPPPPTPFLQGGAVAAPPNERGWKDTVVAMPGEVTRILVPFGAGAAKGAPLAIQSSYTGRYAWHCHILEHEDNDMMQHFEIV